MKRDVIVALAYGVAGLSVGGFLIWSERPGRLREPVVGSEIRSGLVSGQDAGEVPEAESEIGPEGIRWLTRREIGGVDGKFEGGEVERPGGGDEGMQGSPRRRAELPEGGDALLALGDPVVRGVADVLTEAGLSARAVEVSLRDVYGHVQRLATFRGLARADEELAAAIEARTGLSGDSEPGGLPDLRWRIGIWPRRIEEYAGYVSRDLEVRLGITDAAVVARLVGMADRMSEAMPATEASGTTNGSRDPAER